MAMSSRQAHNRYRNANVSGDVSALGPISHRGAEVEGEVTLWKRKILSGFSCPGTADRDARIHIERQRAGAGIVGNRPQHDHVLVMGLLAW
jgi:hypothetical protein